MIAGVSVAFARSALCIGQRRCAWPGINRFTAVGTSAAQADGKQLMKRSQQILVTVLWGMLVLPMVGVVVGQFFHHPRAQEHNAFCHAGFPTDQSA